MRQTHKALWGAHLSYLVHHYWDDWFMEDVPLLHFQHFTGSFDLDPMQQELFTFAPYQDTGDVHMGRQRHEALLSSG